MVGDGTALGVLVSWIGSLVELELTLETGSLFVAGVGVSSFTTTLVATGLGDCNERVPVSDDPELETSFSEVPHPVNTITATTTKTKFTRTKLEFLEGYNQKNISEFTKYLYPINVHLRQS